MQKENLPKMRNQKQNEKEADTSNMEELVIEMINNCGMIISSSVTPNSISYVYSRFKYYFMGKDKPFTYKKCNEFKEALHNYMSSKPLLFSPLNLYIYDTKTKNPKARINFSYKFNEDYTAFKNSNNILTREPATLKYTKEYYESIGKASDITDEMVHLLENNPQIKPYNSDLLKNKDFLAVIAAPGVGKTDAVCDYIRSLPKDTKIIVPSFRCTLAEKQMSDFKDLGFFHYKDKSLGAEINIEKIKKLVIQIDSILRITGVNRTYDTLTNKWLPPRFEGLVVLDEWESIVEHINTTPYMINRSSVIRSLTDLIKYADKVIVMDANLSYSSIKFFREMCNREPYIYKNTYIRNHRILNILTNKFQCQELIEKYIDDKKKIYIPTNSRNWGLMLLNHLSSKYPDLKIKIYDKDTKIEKGYDPISDMINYDCCIVTPKFQAGNSFVEDHFDLVCGYFSGASCSPGGSSQLLTRVRNVIDPNVYLYVDNKIGPKNKALKEIDSFDDMMKYIQEYAQGVTKDIQCALTATDFCNMKISVFEGIDLTNPATFMAVMNKYNMNEGFKDYTGKLLSLLKGMGFVFGENFTPTDEKQRQQLEKEEKVVSGAVKKVRLDIESKNTERIASVELPDDKTYNVIKNKIIEGTATKEEVAQVKKRELLRDVKIADENIKLPTLPENPTPEQITNYNEAKVRVNEIYNRAREIKHSKRLMVKLLPTLINGLPLEQLELVIKNAFYDLSYNQTEILSNDKLANFYNLHELQKIRTIIILFSLLKILGFNFGFFDRRVVDIKNTKESAVAYFNQCCCHGDDKIDLIKASFNEVPTQAQKRGSGLIPFLNKHLKIIFGIKLVKATKDKNTSKYILDSSWILVEDPYSEFGVTVRDKFVECDMLSDTTMTEQKFVSLALKYEANYFESQKEVLKGNKFSDCYMEISARPGAYGIHNIALWDKFMTEKKDDVNFMTRALKIHEGHVLNREYENMLQRQITDEPITWEMFLCRKSGKAPTKNRKFKESKETTTKPEKVVEDLVLPNGLCSI